MVFYKITNKINEIYKLSKEISSQNNINKMFLFVDIFQWYIKYKSPIKEYHLLELYSKNKEERNQYLFSSYFAKKLQEKYKDKQDQIDILIDKINFNNKFKKYLGRAFLVPSQISYNDFLQFYENNKVFVIKLQNAYQGRGFEKIDKDNDKRSAKELYDYICKKNAIIEEYIYQHPEINSLCNTSVNTIRIETISNNNMIEIVGSTIRIGNGADIDGFNAGGFIAKVNIERGNIETGGLNKENKMFKVHPITGTQFEGCKIPMWNEVKEFVIKAAEEASRVIPDIKIIGWDIAISENGPIIVEGNCYPDITFTQILSKKGRKDVYIKAL